MQYRILNASYLKYLTTYSLCFVLVIFSIYSVAGDTKQAEPYVVIDSFGKHYFTEPPKKVVVTDWTLLEQLLDLEIIPVGAPELKQYRTHSTFSILPESIKDIGLRQAPSLKLISDLKPDLIILGTDQKTLARPLSRICKVLYYQNFSPRFKSNAETVFKRNRQLSEIFKRQLTSDTLIEDFNKNLQFNKNLLDQYFVSDKPSVMIIRVFSDGNMIAYSSHSIVGWLIEQLGLKNLTTSNKTKFGEHTILKQEIQNTSPRYLLCFGDCSNKAFHFQNSNTEIIRLDENWPYGGISTMKKMINDITEKLTIH